MGYRALGGQGKNERKGKDFTFSHEWIWTKFTSAQVVVPLLKPPPHSSELHRIHQSHEKKLPKKFSPFLYEDYHTSTSLLSLHCPFLTFWEFKDAAKAPAVVFTIQKESEESPLHLFGAVRRQQSF